MAEPIATAEGSIFSSVSMWTISVFVPGNFVPLKKPESQTSLWVRPDAQISEP